MELINRRHKMYAVPAELKAHEPEYDIRASFGPSPWVQQHICYVRGVRVDKLALRVGDNHVYCRFPDERIMVVAEANIKAVKIGAK